MKNQIRHQFSLFHRDNKTSGSEKYFHLKRKKKSKKTIMYRALVFSAMAGAALGGAIAPQTDIPPQQTHKMQLAGPLTTSESNQSPVYPGLSQQKSPLPSSQFYYPTYPVYQEDSGYGVQAGYEGYLIPTEPQRTTSSWPMKMLYSLAPLSNYALSYGARAGVYLWNLLLLLLIGGAFTAGMCTFTPFCTITFLGLGLSRSQVREQVTELARTYITPESMNAATLLVKNAIDKYAELQRLQRESEQKEKSAKKDAKRRRR